MFEHGGSLFLLLLGFTLLGIYVALERLFHRRVALIAVGVLVVLVVALALFVGFLAATYGGDGGGWRPTR